MKRAAEECVEDSSVCSRSTTGCASRPNEGRTAKAVEAQRRAVGRGAGALIGGPDTGGDPKEVSPRSARIALVTSRSDARSPPPQRRSTRRSRDPEVNAKKAGATVEIKVSGIQLVDPASAHEKPQAGQGHLHYRVDDGPVIATTAPKLSFHELSRGEHRFELTLVGNDHKPLMPTKTLRVTVPATSERSIDGTIHFKLKLAER